MAKITIFGLAGTGKSSTAEKLAEELGYKFLSTGNMFREMAKEAGYGNDLPRFEKEVCEKDPEFDNKLDKHVEKYGKTHDNFVFESRLAWYFIPDSYKVMLVCNNSERFKRIADRENKPVEQVEEETLAREDSIYKRFSDYYKIENIADKSRFDLIVDTEANKLDEVVKIIESELKEKKIIAQKWVRFE
jgi:cytidylate kinase